jgi:hypothetical protein
MSNRTKAAVQDRQFQIIVALDPNGRAMMKRDMDLIRKILFAVETRTNALPEAVVVEGYDKPIVIRHVQMLMEAGLLDGNQRADGRSHYPIITITDLSWQGHEFLAAVRHDGIWNKIKQRFGAELPNLPFVVVREVGLGLVKQWALGQVGLS